MKKRRILCLTGVLALGLGLTIALLWVLGGSTTPVTAAPASRPLQASGDVYCVTPVSQTYAGCTRVFTSVQFAVDAAIGGEIVKIAAGIYTDIHRRSNITQVVYIDIPITIRGGYTTTDNFAGPPDPDTYPTTLDAGGQGRVVYVTGVTATLEGLRLTNGSASNGGGIHASSTTTRSLVISGCQVYSNAATPNGGGIYITDSYFPTLTGNKIYSNTASNNGGGIYFNLQTYVVPALTGNDVYSNTADREGGGIWLAGGANATLTDNDVYSNTATGGGGFSNGGGGVFLRYSAMAMLTGNHVYLNTAASAGGGIALWNSDNATLANNWVYSNTSDGNGGGIYLGTAPTATLLSNWVYSNTADSGGGIFLGGGTNATLTDNDIYRNAAATDGGGIVLGDSSDATVRDNQVYSNTATEDGGGIAVTGNCHDTVVEHNDIHDNIARRYGGGIYTSNAPTLTLMHNQIYSNTALASGGGLHCQTSDAMLLAANDIHSNLGGGGGGIVLYSSDDVTLAGNQIYANTAITYNGGGLAADFSTGIRLVNNLVVDNRALASDRTPGIHIVRSDARFLHNTLARNTGGSGVGLLLHSVVTDYATAALTNTILVSHAVGIEVGQNSTATLAGTLWGEGAWANGDDWGGPGAIISSTNVTGDPAFVDPDGGDYHITGASAGRDVAVSTVVTDDIDGDSRPFGAGPDIGADEAQCHARLNGTYYRSVQAAVDASASPTDVVQVAGTCRGVETRASYDQVVYISKTLTVRGGYSPDFSAWDPQVYPTTLDAQEQGRVIRIAGTTPGSITPTLEGLRLTNGRINNWGGGVLSRFASTIISGCHIYNNTSANQFGGGIYIDAGPNAALVNSQVYSNSAGTSFGGGLYIAFSDDVISVGNTFHNNTAASGGGMYLYHSDATLVNNVVADNEASDRGSGLYISNCSPRLLHTTIARNSGESGQAIYVSGSGHTVWMTNTILVSHTVGITVTGGNTATLEATLWGGGDWANDLNWGGDGHIVGSANVTGDPSFVDPDGGDYHITGASAAVDEGVPMWVSTDIDGDARTVSSAPDLGADESTFVLKVVKAGPAWVSEGAPIAYTLRVTNTGLVTAVNVVLTDSLPAGAGFVSASDGGGLESSDVVTWPTFTLAPNGGSVARTFTVTATETITNDDYMAAPQGLPGVRGAVVVATYVNHAPTANAEAIPNTLHTGAVTLDGSGSSDPDGDALSYQWAQTGGPVAVSLAGAGAMTATFTAPLFGGVYTFTLAVSDTYDLSDSDTTAVTVTLPVIAIAKSGPDEVEVGEPITYTLIVTNSGSLAASSLVITDALPTGASFIAASDGGLLVGDVVSWTATSLGMMDRLTRTFTVTATETITNSDYRASCGEGVSAVGTVSVVTEVSSERKIYLPLVLRGFQ